MTDQKPHTLKADLFLLHAPSVYDFRNRDDVLFAYLSDSDSVNVTSIFEMFPLGFFSLRQRLREDGFAVEIVNIASLMLMYPTLDVPALIGRLEAPVFGLDLHWMAQCHGAIELAAEIKRIHPDAMVIFGGLSATYFARELIRYPAVDLVAVGYDTLDPMSEFMVKAVRGERDFAEIPNLLYKDRDGEVIETGFSHKPKRFYNDATVDWSYYGKVQTGPATSKMIMTLPNTGCSRDCGWCGGSRYAYSNFMGTRQTLIGKRMSRVIDELKTMGDAAKVTSIYALQCYSESRSRMGEYLDAVREMGYQRVFFELFSLPDEDMVRKMAASTQVYVMLSPESHDLEISRLSGRGTYTMEAMEAWIERALDLGLAGVMVWFFIGMPGQDARSVMDTVAYAEALLKKFRGRPVVPLLCPMVPFLDPGSRFFEQPGENGYRIFHRSLAEHRAAMVATSWHERLNYETVWMSRHDLQDVTYRSVRRLIEAKGKEGSLPLSLCDAAVSMIDETLDLLKEVDRAMLLDGCLPADLRRTIQAYNGRVLSYSTDQIIPMERPFGGRWFDDVTVPQSMIAELVGNRN